MDKQQITDIVIENVKGLVETLPEDQQFNVDVNTVLFGKGSNIDSLSLVSIIVDLESIFSLDYNFELSLTDDRAMTRKQSPFDSVQTMSDYIWELVSEQQ